MAHENYVIPAIVAHIPGYWTAIRMVFINIIFHYSFIRYYLNTSKIAYVTYEFDMKNI